MASLFLFYYVYFLLHPSQYPKVDRSIPTGKKIKQNKTLFALSLSLSNFLSSPINSISAFPLRSRSFF